jgi:hypothetical protein
VPTLASDPTDDGLEGDSIPATERRRFLGQVVGGAAALATAACAHPQAGAQAPSPTPAPGTTAKADSMASAQPVPPPMKFDLSWTDRLTGTRKQVFDAPEIAEGTVLHQARMFFVNYQEMYQTTDADLRAVLVIRHEAIPMVLNDAMWAKYPFIGQKITKLKDPTSGMWTRRNPFINVAKGDQFALTWPDGGLDTLISRGAIVLACNLALNGFAHTVATTSKEHTDDVRTEFHNSLIPGVTLVPSGVFGVIRAEEGGCNYIRAT